MSESSSDEAAAKVKRRWWPWLVGAALAVLLVGGGWVLASAFQSSAQQEANATAPVAAPVFSPVSEGTLARQVSFTGTVGPSAQVSVTLPAVAGAAVSVVTGHPVAAGATVISGSVLTEINGGPVFAAKSPFAFYRDMGYGDLGPDITALQGVLVSKGYLGTADGKFGAGTVRAVRNWYRANGYDAPTRVRPNSDATGSDSQGAGSTTSSGADATSSSGDGGAAANRPSTTTVVNDAYVPISEIVAITTSPSRVLQGVTIGTHTGDSATGGLLLGSTDLVITVSVPAAELGGVVEGDHAKVTVAGAEIDGVVGKINQPAAAADGQSSSDTQAQAGTTQAGVGQPSQGGDQAANVTFQILPATALPAGTTGTVQVNVTKDVVAEKSLLVPTLAIVDSGGDRKAVAKHRSDGSLVEVPVTVIGMLQGQVAIAPVKAGALAAGDEVRVG